MNVFIAYVSFDCFIDFRRVNNHRRLAKVAKPLAFNHAGNDDIFDEVEAPVVKPRKKPIVPSVPSLPTVPTVRPTEKIKINAPKSSAPKKVSSKSKVNKHVALENCFNERLKDGFNFEKYLSCIEEFQGFIKPTTAWPMDVGNKKPAAKGTVKKVSYGGGFDNVYDDEGYSDEIIRFYDRTSDIFQSI